MIFKDESPQYLTSAELQEAIRRHREHTKKLLAEARRRRAEAAKVVPVRQADKPSDDPNT